MDSKHESKEYATSIHSVASTTTTLLDTSKGSFLEGKRFHVEAKGIRAFRPPMPMRQNEIPIYTADGTLAYTATKEKAMSSHTILASPKHGDLFSIDFRPGCCPWIRFLNPVEGDVIPEIALQGKLTTRAMSFTPPEGGCRWEWKYSTIDSPSGGKLKALCLEKIDGTECGKATRIAYLLRSPDTRATGSSCCSAGNGGQLVISPDVDLSMVEEALVIATCLVMLRRERDRRRFIQAMVIGEARYVLDSEQKELAGIARKVNSLKGSSGSLGLTKVTNGLIKIQEDCTKQIKDGTEELDSFLERIMKALEDVKADYSVVKEAFQEAYDVEDNQEDNEDN